LVRKGGRFRPGDELPHDTFLELQGDRVADGLEDLVEAEAIEEGLHLSSLREEKAAGDGLFPVRSPQVVQLAAAEAIREEGEVVERRTES